MKFIYACDIHGDEYKYEKLYKIAIKQNLKYIVLGGDLLPKFGSDRYAEQLLFIQTFLNDYFTKLEEQDIKCICILGNDDMELLDKEFNKICRKHNNICRKHNNIYNIDGKKADFEDIRFIGMSNVIDHPFGCKDRVVNEVGLKMPMQLSNRILVIKSTEDISVEEWQEYRKHIDFMEDLFEELPKESNRKKTIYVFHNPPYGCGLDVCMNRQEVGSKAMQRFLLNSYAYMSLHGHIHESPTVSNRWNIDLNGTIAIQPGQTEFGNKKFNYVIVDTDKDEYKRYTN